MKTIAVDIDGTLRDLETQIGVFLEFDHPEKYKEWIPEFGKVYRSLSPVFESEAEVFKWMYDERVFELFGKAERLHKKVIDDLNMFTIAAKQNGWDVVIASVQRDRSITATLHWLSKYGCRVPTINFFHTFQDKIDANFDIYVDDSPEVLDAVCKTTTGVNARLINRAIKVPYEFNSHVDCPSLDIVNGQFNTLYEIMGWTHPLKGDCEA